MKPHHPNKFPVRLDYSKFAILLGKAQYALGQLNGLHQRLQNPFLIMAPLSTKEATVSSSIEGTQSTISDVFLFEAGEKTRHKDVIEVSNYKRASSYAMVALKDRSFNISFIKSLHSILLKDTRGSKMRGRFREDQVWVGKSGDPIEKAQYTPPEALLVQEYMENLESFLSLTDEDLLVQTALIHYQFEAIHPFNDGNGRIGRLLIPLFLFHRQKLAFPILYLSGYFEAHRDAYLDSLHSVDVTGKHEGWVKYFLKAVILQVKETTRLIDKILILHEKARKKTDNIKSPYISKVIDFIFKRPVFTVRMVMGDIKAHRSTLIRLFDELVKKRILVEVTPRGRRKKIFIFRELVRML